MKLEGIIPAVASPCDQHDVFLEDTFARLIDTLYQEEIRGLYVCGNTGDGYKMRLEERKRAVEIALDGSRLHGGMVIVHVGSPTNTREAVELAEHAAASGATAISSLPPARCNQTQLVQYYRDIARASQLPTLVYHIPVITGLDLTVDELTELLDIEGVVGLKFTDWNLFLLRQLFLARPDAVIFSGFDEILCPALLYGACGGIGTWYNLFPGLYVKIYRAVCSGDHDQAMNAQYRLLAFLDLAWRFGVMDVFELLMRRRGFGPFVFRRPRREPDLQAYKDIEPELMKQLAAIEEIL